jgi:hypothetical protein
VSPGYVCCRSHSSCNKLEMKRKVGKEPEGVSKEVGNDNSGPKMAERPTTGRFIRSLTSFAQHIK